MARGDGIGSGTGSPSGGNTGSRSGGGRNGSIGTNAGGRDTPGSPNAPDGNRGSTMGQSGGRSNAIGNDAVSGEAIAGSTDARQSFGESTNADGRDTPGSPNAPDGNRGATMGIDGGRVGSNGRDAVNGSRFMGIGSREISDAAIEKAVMEKSWQESFTEGVNKYAPNVMKSLMPGPLGLIAGAAEMVDGYVNDQSLADSGPHGPGAPMHEVPGVRTDGTVAGTPSADLNPDGRNQGGIINPPSQSRQPMPSPDELRPNEPRPELNTFGVGRMTNYGSYRRRLRRSF